MLTIFKTQWAQNSQRLQRILKTEQEVEPILSTKQNTHRIANEEPPGPEVTAATAPAPLPLPLDCLRLVSRGGGEGADRPSSATWAALPLRVFMVFTSRILDPI